MKRIALVLLSSLLFSCGAMYNKKVIGETAVITVAEAKMDFVSRIDTGATVTSIHVVDLQIENESKDKEKNVGKLVTFVTENKQGKRATIKLPISDVAKVKNSQGLEYRYVVKMHLNWAGQPRLVEVNLRDRSAMTYKLLIGRNWLANHYVVDVTKSED
jgi:hypothetical protein